MIVLATSPGPGGASTVLENAVSSMPHFDGVVKGSYSLPCFYDNFDLDSNKITNPELLIQLKEVVNGLSEA